MIIIVLSCTPEGLPSDCAASAESGTEAVIARSSPLRSHSIGVFDADGDGVNGTSDELLKKKKNKNLYQLKDFCKKKKITKLLFLLNISVC